jgi:internalin A
VELFRKARMDVNFMKTTRYVLYDYKTEKLYLDYNNISDISLLKNLTDLKYLSIQGNNISDLSPLRNLNLRHLNLSNNNITDISPLKNLLNLEELDLSNNNITDISSLKNLKKLEHLNLMYNPIKKEDIRKLEKVLPKCKIYY